MSRTGNDGVDEVAKRIETMTALLVEAGFHPWEVGHVGTGFENACRPCGSHPVYRDLAAKELVASNGPR